MPPTATEVNARLHKAVNEEGNVLNMEAVNDMITWLEKINITMEVLEETRIGKRMNLMRKNLQDKELAKRVKNLLKKWKKEIKNNGNANDITNNRFNSQPGNLQNLKRNIDNNIQAGVKRKRTSAENSPLQRTGSPRVSSPSLSAHRLQQSSSLVNSSPLKLVSSPKLQTDKLPRNVSNPKNKTKIQEKHVENTPSPLINNSSHNNVQIDCNNKISDVLNKNQAKSNVPNNSNGLHTVNETETENRLKDLTKAEEFDFVKDTDTRTQEDRISSLDSGYQGTLSCDENSPSLSPDDKIFLPIEKTTELGEEVRSTTPEHYEPIEREDLEKQRKEIPDNPVSPKTEADGVNGIYDENDQFCDWTEEITYKEKDYHVLPYVILD